MNHFTQRLTSPFIGILIGYIYVFILFFILYFLGFYENSSFFSVGIPVKLMGINITSWFTYTCILFLFFVHQLVNNLVNNVTYPWIINCVQDPKSTNLVYSKKKTMIIVNMFALYSEIDVLVIISGIMSQVTFFIAIIIANMISVTIINWAYVKDKNRREMNAFLNV